MESKSGHICPVDQENSFTPGQWAGLLKWTISQEAQDIGNIQFRAVFLTWKSTEFLQATVEVFDYHVK